MSLVLCQSLSEGGPSRMTGIASYQLLHQNNVNGYDFPMAYFEPPPWVVQSQRRDSGS
jgi:hypothetical protein